MYAPLRSARAHPRACGENTVYMFRAARTCGSSPRVRGKRNRNGNRAWSPGLIPARAGKTPPAPSSAPAPRAHPRACGENLERTSAPGTVRGSSPRVRGKPVPLTRPLGLLRLIPARAGKTRAPHPHRGAQPAHPRACGENYVHLVNALARGGSSPRVRGKLDPRPPPHQPNRLIPARAGKTPGSSTSPPHSPAHPRACGENMGVPIGVGGGGGSSPRVRGKRPPPTRRLWGNGLIPARAGKTGRRRPW